MGQSHRLRYSPGQAGRAVLDDERSPRRRTVRWVTRQILFHEPTEHCRPRGAPRAAFERLPVQRSLFRAREDCGLPIGWLNSYLGYCGVPGQTAPVTRVTRDSSGGA